jgi:hypothetical protein
MVGHLLLLSMFLGLVEHPTLTLTYDATIIYMYVINVKRQMFCHYVAFYTIGNQNP